MRTPWGPSQHTTEEAPGVVWVSTASHGGYRVTEAVAKLMHPAMRGIGERMYGYLWFEEDCAWSAVGLSFPGLEESGNLSEGMAEQAKDTCINWYPDQWEAFTGETIPDGGSYIRTSPYTGAIQREENSQAGA